MEVVHICIDEENSSFNCSNSTSQIEDISAQKRLDSSDAFDSCALIKVHKPSDSDLDVSFKSAKEHRLECETRINKIIINQVDSLTQLSNHDEYDTCVDESLSEETSKKNIEDESLSIEALKVEIIDNVEDNSLPEEASKINIIDNMEDESLSEEAININIIDNIEDDVTPTNSKPNILSAFGSDSEATTVINAASEPCLQSVDLHTHHIYLDSRPDQDLKSYDQSDFLDPDEFFLVQYHPKTLYDSDVIKSTSEPHRLTYHLREYYNDYEDCIESYIIKEEMDDVAIFNDIYLPIKSRSAPNIVDSSFVTLTYDPGPSTGHRRKSCFTPAIKDQRIG